MLNAHYNPLTRTAFRLQAPFDEGRIAQSDGNEDVEPGAALDEQPRDLGRLADQVLRRRRFVIGITRVDVRPTIDKILRDLHRARAVQGSLSIAAARLDERWIAVDELAHPIEDSKVQIGAMGEQQVEQRADPRHVARVQREHELLDGRLVDRIDLVFHRRPALEPVATGDDELRIGKLQGFLGRRDDTSR